MLNRNTIAAFAIATSAIAAPAVADDGDVRHAQRLLEQARTYGTQGITGQAAGQTDARRDEREARENLDSNEQRWREIARSQSLN